MRRSAITVLVNAGPWLPVPPVAYGGLENVVATLVPELRRRGVRVVLATVEESELCVDEVVSAFATGQFDALTRPYNQVGALAHAHMQAVVRRLRRGDIDMSTTISRRGARSAASSDVARRCTRCTGSAAGCGFYREFDGRGRSGQRASPRTARQAPVELPRVAGAVPLPTRSRGRLAPVRTEPPHRARRICGSGTALLLAWHSTGVAVWPGGGEPSRSRGGRSSGGRGICRRAR